MKLRIGKPAIAPQADEPIAPLQKATGPSPFSKLLRAANDEPRTTMMSAQGRATSLPASDPAREVPLLTVAHGPLQAPPNPGRRASDVARPAPSNERGLVERLRVVPEAKAQTPTVVSEKKPEATTGRRATDRGELTGERATQPMPHVTNAEPQATMAKAEIGAAKKEVAVKTAGAASVNHPAPIQPKVTQTSESDPHGAPVQPRVSATETPFASVQPRTAQLNMVQAVASENHAGSAQPKSTEVASANVPRVVASQPHLAPNVITTRNQPASHQIASAQPPATEVVISQHQAASSQPNGTGSKTHVASTQPHATDVTTSQHHVASTQPHVSRVTTSHHVAPAQRNVASSQPNATSEPHVAPAQPNVATPKSQVASAPPDVASTQPNATSQPHVAPVQPNVATSKSQVASAPPDVIRGQQPAQQNVSRLERLVAPREETPASKTPIASSTPSAPQKLTQSSASVADQVRRQPAQTTSLSMPTFAGIPKAADTQTMDQPAPRDEPSSRSTLHRRRVVDSNVQPNLHTEKNAPAQSPTAPLVTTSNTSFVAVPDQRPVARTSPDTPVVPLARDLAHRPASTVREEATPTPAHAPAPREPPAIAATLFSVSPTVSSTAVDTKHFGTGAQALKAQPATTAPMTRGAEKPASLQGHVAQVLQFAAQRTTKPTEPEKTATAETPATHKLERAEQKKRSEPERDEKTVLPLPTSPAPLQPTELPAPQRVAEASAPQQPNPLPNVAPAYLDDPSLRVVVLPNIARLSVETQDSGTLSLQVKVHDGVTDIRAAGPAASLVEARQGELRLALAHEGLALGHFDLTQSDHQGAPQHRFEPHDEREPSPRRTHVRPESSGSTTRAEGRLSVKA